MSKLYLICSIKVKAPDNVSFTIEEVEICCIKGKNGSGKSKLLRQLDLLDRPTRGKIILSGRIVTDITDAERAKLRLSYLGYIFQEDALLEELIVVENLFLPAKMLSWKNDKYKERATEHLHLGGLSEKIDHLPSGSSGSEE